MSSKQKKVFVLTREHNDYNQYGSYFVAVYETQPSIEALAEALKHKVNPHSIMEAVTLLAHVRAGGGRQGDENEWFNLEQVDLL